MRHLRSWWLIVLLLMSIPYVLIFAAGSMWLYEKNLLWQWGAAAAVLTLASWWWARRLARLRRPPSYATVEPSDHWPPAGRNAWKEVEAIAERVQQQNVPLNQPDALWKVLGEVLENVARAYYPRSKRAVLEVPVPHVLRVIELVARDLRLAFSQQVPGSHILTLHDFNRLRRLAGWWTPLYTAYRIGSFAVNPIAAAIREARDVVAGKLFDTSVDEIKRWSVGFCIRKAGYYAIQLYSGELVLELEELATLRTRLSTSDTSVARQQADRLAQEPLRILVVGQVKSGKSSLINALFGETRAATDVVPRTRYVDPYVLERDGIPRAIILDTAGYESVEAGENPFAELEEEIVRCDLLLLVCSARSATRAADRYLLDELRAFFQREPNRMMPPVLSAATFIDQLRPLNEWDPPYNIAQPDRPKARHIAEFVQTVAADLAIDPAAVIPVCLKPGLLYNVEEGLATAILVTAPEAQRVKYLRCLRQHHDEQYWERLWQQAVNSGRVLWRAGLQWLTSR